MDVGGALKNFLYSVVTSLPIIGPIIKFVSIFIEWIVKTWLGKIAVIIMLVLLFLSFDLALPIVLGGLILGGILYFLLPMVGIYLPPLTMFAISMGIVGVIVIVFWKGKEAMLFIILLVILIGILLYSGFL